MKYKYDILPDFFLFSFSLFTVTRNYYCVSASSTFNNIRAKRVISPRNLEVCHHNGLLKLSLPRDRQDLRPGHSRLQAQPDPQATATTAIPATRPVQQATWADQVMRTIGSERMFTGFQMDTVRLTPQTSYCLILTHHLQQPGEKRSPQFLVARSTLPIKTRDMRRSTSRAPQMPEAPTTTSRPLRNETKSEAVFNDWTWKIHKA